jgi:tripartite-type tricarboxylate transporter receptor subunit TctC
MPVAQDVAAQRGVTMIVPFAPGASADSVARIFSEKLGELLSQTIVVENKPGAGGSTGLIALSKSPADGATLGVGATGALVINPHVSEGDGKLSPLTQLAPIAKLVDIPLVIVAAKSAGIGSLKDMIARSQATAEGLSFGTTGTNSAQHLSIELLKRATGAKLVHVPYRGSAPVMNDLIGGQIPIGSVDLTAAQAHIASGAVVPLAVTSASRISLAPDIPTVAESAVPGFEINAWIGLFGPAGLAAEAISQLSQKAQSALADDKVRARVRDAGCVPAYLAAADFATFLAKESAKMRDLVKT